MGNIQTERSHAAATGQRRGSAAGRRGNRRSASGTLNGGAGGSSQQSTAASQAPLPSSCSQPVDMYASGAGAGDFPPPQTSIIADKEPLTSTQKQLVRQCWMGIRKRSTVMRSDNGLPTSSKQAERTTLFAARRDPVSFGEKVLSRTITRHPEFKELFGWENYQNNRELYATQDFQKHAHLIESTINDVVMNIQNMEENVRPRLFQIGQKHAQIASVRPSKQHIQTIHWDFVSEAVLKVVADSRVRNPQGLVAAWRILVCWIINLLRDGFLTGQFAIKVQQRRMSAPLLHIAQHNATYMRCTANTRGSRGELSEAEKDDELAQFTSMLEADWHNGAPSTRRSQSLQSTPRRVGHNSLLDDDEPAQGNGHIVSPSDSTQRAFERIAAEIQNLVDKRADDLYDDDLPPPAGGDVPL